MRPGYCAIHPLVPAASGEKFKCLSCVENARKIQTSGQSCKVHPMRPVASDSLTGLCRECQDMANATLAREELKAKEKKRGRPADPAKKEAREKHAAEVAARKAAREAAAAKLAAKGDSFHSWEAWDEDEYLEELNTLPYGSAERSEFLLNTPCYLCGVGKKKHGIAKHATTDLAYPELSPEKRQSVPVLVLVRGATMEEALEKASKLAETHKNLLRFGRIDYLPRIERVGSDRARIADLVTGKHVQQLDPTPWALWMPIDNTRERISFSGNEWVREVPKAVSIMGKPAIEVEEIPVNPPARVRGDRWVETDMNGAEVLDLRNYPEVLKETRETISQTLAESAGWMEALKNSVRARNGEAIYKGIKNYAQMSEIRDVILGIDREECALPVMVYRNTEAFA